MKKKKFTERKIITFYSSMEKHKIFKKVIFFYQTLPCSAKVTLKKSFEHEVSTLNFSSLINFSYESPN